MEWLKDKKNLPIVAGMAVVVLLAMAGLIAFELGAFSGGSSATVAQAPISIASGYPGGVVGGYPGGAVGGYPSGTAGGYPGGTFSATPTAAVPSARVASAAKMNVVNPLVGVDPFALPNGRKIMARASGLTVANASRPPLRDALPPLNLFTLRPPSPQLSSNFNLPNGADQLLASTRVSGIVNAADGIFAVVEVNGTSQTVKPGDALPDGSKVASIQSSGVTLHTPGGGSITVPLSNGPPEQSQPNPYGGGFGGGGYPGGFGGYPGAGGGYPGGFPGGGYPGGGGGGYPGGGGFPGGGFPGGGGYPGGGGEGGGGGYPQ